MKTPEQMAEEFSDFFKGERRKTIAKKSWYTGFEEGLKRTSLQWISVKERLPESISDVLVVTKEKESYVGYYRSSDNDWNMYNPCCSFHMELHGVTHWMPLPEAPKE